jgi:hypothetical protein
MSFLLKQNKVAMMRKNKKELLQNQCFVIAPFKFKILVSREKRLVFMRLVGCKNAGLVIVI